MSWKPGDRAVVVGSPRTSWNGRVLTVLSSEILYAGRAYVKIDPCPENRIGIWVQYLRKIDDDYDGRQLASWDECVWQPKREVAA